MKVIGINTSHDTAICSMTDGKIDFYHEEARWQRNKWFTPMFDFGQDCDEEQKFADVHWKTLDYALSQSFLLTAWYCRLCCRQHHNW